MGIKKQLIKIRKSLSVKLKILLSFLQIVTSMGFNLNGIPFPKRYMEFTEALAFISFNFFVFLPIDCLTIESTNYWTQFARDDNRANGPLFLFPGRILPN